MASTGDLNARPSGGQDSIFNTQFVNMGTVASNLKHMKRTGPYGEETADRENLFSEYKAQADLFETLIANASFGVILVSSNGRIIYANNAASTLIRLKRGVCSHHGRIKATDVKTNQKLQSLIFAASFTVNQTISDGSIILPTQNSQELLAVHVVPICRRTSERDVSQGDLNGSPCVAALFIAN